VLRLVLGHGLLLVAAGIVVGMAAALAMSFAIPPGLLPNVSARDPLTLIGTCVLLTAVALAANYLPARRATRIDPLIALRTE
jgi:ABC-type antimicrobial peptide transport system permease subunit